MEVNRQADLRHVLAQRVALSEDLERDFQFCLSSTTHILQ